MAAESVINAIPEERKLGAIADFVRNEKYYSIRYTTGEHARLTILNDHVFRYHMTPNGQFAESPTPDNTTNAVSKVTKPIQDSDKHASDKSILYQNKKHYIVQTNDIRISFDRLDGTLEVHDKRTDEIVLSELKPIQYNDSICKQTLHQSKDEYFYGGGMQMGRFTHKSEKIHIDHPHDWATVDTLCPYPFYWSTKGYGVLRNTWKAGYYDFGSNDLRTVETAHEDDNFDAFLFINPVPKDILNDYYELTGWPILIPEYAFYEAHINTFNIVYWYECGLDGLNVVHVGENDTYYTPFRESATNGQLGILGSLNGEKPFYNFSARFMIDWYKTHDMPLGWFIANNESGYGQTETFEGDLDNLKKFVEYAKENGVVAGVWVDVDSCLKPKHDTNLRKEDRDLDKEFNVGVLALKCDTAWSTSDDCLYRPNALENATKIVSNATQNRVRPFIITFFGWAGVQKYAGVSSGAYTGGMWEYIRQHIPAYIGAGLSGIPVVGSDMDGTYGGGDIEVYIRDFQWKTFTPLQLNTDGWGRPQKIPFSFNCLEAIILNRAYLKLKSMLMPYNYTIAYESTQNLPMIRAMFLEFPEEVASYTTDSQYQFMWGPNILVAPVFANKDLHRRPEYVDSGSFYWVDHEFEYVKQKPENVPVRNGFFLPDKKQVWIDLFTGDKYQGGKIYNNFKIPIWKIPVFVKDGAIIPLVNANNNPGDIKRDCRVFLLYPNGKTTFEVYEDDGKSSEYLEEKYAKTKISVVGPASNQKGNVSINIQKTTGCYKNMAKEKKTILQIMTSKKIKGMNVTANEKKIPMRRAKNQEKYENSDNVYYFDRKFMLNSYLKGFDTNDMLLSMLCIKIEENDITETDIKVAIEGFSNKGVTFGSKTTVIENLQVPKLHTPKNADVTATMITLRWGAVDASYYEIERDEHTIFSNILEDKFTFKYFKYRSKHTFRIRAVTKEGLSNWSNSIVVETTDDPFKGIVKDVLVSCNKTSEHTHDINNLTKIDQSWWHTEWDYYCVWKYLDEDKKMDSITISFDLNAIHKIYKIAYIPREDAGNGTFLQGLIWLPVEGVFDRVFRRSCFKILSVWVTLSMNNQLVGVTPSKPFRLGYLLKGFRVFDRFDNPFVWGYPFHHCNTVTLCILNTYSVNCSVFDLRKAINVFVQ